MRAILTRAGIILLAALISALFTSLITTLARHLTGHATISPLPLIALTTCGDGS